MVFWFLFIFSFLFLYVFQTRTGNLFLDIPNQRSMHQKPVKRAGGLVFTLIFLVGVFYFYLEKRIDSFYFQFIFSGVLFFLLLGIADDVWNLSFKKKAVLELSFLFGLLYLFNLPNKITIFQVDLPHAISLILFVLYMFFTINLCNFMDGLDLYLSVSFIIFSVNLYASDLNVSSTYLFILLVYIICILPFLYFNFPNAKMFMGDSGSLPIGFMVACFPLFLEDKFHGELSLAPIMLPMFWVDGVYTIFIRLKRKQNIFLAHREHLYQKIQIKFFTKIQTLLTFLYFNFLPSFLFVIHAFGIIKSFWFTYFLIFFVSHIVYFYLYFLVRKNLHNQSL